MDGVVSPETAASRSASSAASACSTSRGIWTRYEDADDAARARSRRCRTDRGDARRCRRSTREPVEPELIAAADREIKAAGVVAAGVAHPAAACESTTSCALEAGLDILVIQGTVDLGRARVLERVRPLNLKEFIAELPIPVLVGGCAQLLRPALHLMRTGAAGVLVGVGPGAACTTRGVLGIGVPQATAIAGRRRGALAAPARDRRVRAT